MVVLHSALLKVLRSFFRNFDSDYRVQEAAERRRTRDVEENADVFQFNVSAVYQLHASWPSRWAWFCWSALTRERVVVTVPLSEVTSASPSPAI